MEERRTAAAEEGSEGRRGLRERGLHKGLEETVVVDLNKGLVEVEVEEQKEAKETEEIWDGILTLTGA